MKIDDESTRRRSPRRAAEFSGRSSRSRPLSDAARLLRESMREQRLGPYETRYDVRNGYGVRVGYGEEKSRVEI